MAERMTVEISIGGTLPKRLVPGLLEAIWAEGICLTGTEAPLDTRGEEDLLRAAKDDGQASPLSLLQHEVGWGRFETLETFLMEHNIAFDRWSAGKYEFDPELFQFRPGKDRFACATLQNQEPVVEARLVASALDALERGEHDRATKILRAALGPEIEPLQPFQIEQTKE